MERNPKIPKKEETGKSSVLLLEMQKEEDSEGLDGTYYR